MQFNDFEDLYPVPGTKPKPDAIRKIGKQILIRLEPADYQKLITISEKWKLTTSQTIRQIIRKVEY